MSASYTNNDAELILCPGFRFHPTEEELIDFYLWRKLEKLHLIQYDPWDLQSEIMHSKSIISRTRHTRRAGRNILRRTNSYNGVVNTRLNFRGLSNSSNGGGGTSWPDLYQTSSSPGASFSNIQLTQLITMIEERQRMRHYSPSRDFPQDAIRVNVAGGGLVTEIKQDDDSGHLSDYTYNNSAGREDCQSRAQVRAADNFHTEGEGMHQPSPMDVPQDVCIDIIEPDKTGTVYDFKMEKKGSVRIRVHRSGHVMSETILGITGQAAVSLLGYGLVNNSFSKPALSFVVSAYAVGFIGTLTAISLRDKKREPVARILAKVGAIAAASATVVAMGMYLPVDFIWTSGVACLIPAAAVAFA